MKMVRKIPMFLALFCCVGILVSFLVGSSDMMFYSIGCIVFAVIALVMRGQEKRKNKDN